MIGAALAAALLASGCGGGTGHTTSGSAVTRRSVPPESTHLLANQRFPPGPPAEQTSPSVSPATGSTRTTFMLSLTARTHLGIAGPVRHDYRVILRGPHPRCAEFTEIEVGAPGARLRKALVAPYYLGWCRGSYRGLVVLDTNPVCNPTPGSPPCVLFATRSLAVGRFTFSTS